MRGFAMRVLATRGALALACSAAAVTTVAAQDGSVPATRFGVFGGMASSSISAGDGGLLDIADATFRRERRIGALAGAFLTIPLNARLSLQPELQFVQKGVQYSGRLGDGLLAPRATSALNLGYLEAPLLLRADFGAVNTTRPFVVLGPALAYNVSCGVAFSALGVGGSVDCDVSDELVIDPIGLRTVDVGGVVGGGVAFLLGGREYTLGARYTVGLRDVAEIASGSRNGSAAVLLGVTF